MEEKMFSETQDKDGTIVTISTFSALKPTLSDLIKACEKAFPNIPFEEIRIDGMPSISASIK